MLRRWLLLGLVAAFGGCSLVVSTDGLTGSSSGGGGSSGVIASGDASPDGATDGGTPREAGASVCDVVPKPYFCATFDDGRALSAVFSTVNVVGGSLTIDPGASKSAPRSLLVNLPANAGALSAEGQVTLPAKITKARVDLDLLVEELGGADQHDFIGFYRDGTHEVTLEIRPDGVLQVDEDIPVVDGGPGQTKTPLGVTVQVGKWTHIQWDVAISGATASSTIRIDGGPATSASSAAAAFQNARLVVGDHSTNALTKTWRDRIDDVVLTVE